MLGPCEHGLRLISAEIPHIWTNSTILGPNGLFLRWASATFRPHFGSISSTVRLLLVRAITPALTLVQVHWAHTAMIDQNSLILRWASATFVHRFGAIYSRPFPWQGEYKFRWFFSISLRGHFFPVRRWLCVAFGVGPRNGSRRLDPPDDIAFMGRALWLCPREATAINDHGLWWARSCTRALRRRLCHPGNGIVAFVVYGLRWWSVLGRAGTGRSQGWLGATVISDRKTAGCGDDELPLGGKFAEVVREEPVMPVRDVVIIGSNITRYCCNGGSSFLWQGLDCSTYHLPMPMNNNVYVRVTDTRLGTFIHIHAYVMYICTRIYTYIHIYICMHYVLCMRTWNGPRKRSEREIPQRREDGQECAGEVG